jgi:hypothetical protein
VSRAGAAAAAGARAGRAVPRAAAACVARWSGRPRANGGAQAALEQSGARGARRQSRARGAGGTRAGRATRAAPGSAGDEWLAAA